MPTGLYIPEDVCLEILSHFPTPLHDDTKTVLALALCCRSFCDGSQRLLFSSMQHNPPTDSFGHLYSALTKHSKFLHTVVGSADRLARYVRSYSQYQLALDPKLRSSKKASAMYLRNHYVDIWARTVKALPLMVNLKNFDFAPLISHPAAPTVFRECIFQLDSLIWREADGTIPLYTSLLERHHNQLHLGVTITIDRYYDEYGIRVKLWPSPISIACLLWDLSRATAGKPIVSLHLATETRRDGYRPSKSPMTKSLIERVMTTLQKVHYLRVWDLPPFRQFSGGLKFYNITVLRVSGVIENVGDLTQFPNLFCLQFRSYKPYSNVASDTNNRFAIAAFTQLPKLKSILIFAEAARVDLAWRLLRRFNKGIVADEVPLDNYNDSTWWRLV